MGNTLPHEIAMIRRLPEHQSCLQQAGEDANKINYGEFPVCLHAGI
jgi:hypothetical protein